MSKLHFSFYCLLLICVFHQQIVFGDSDCECVDKINCSDDDVHTFIHTRRLNKQCPKNQVCCNFKKKPNDVDENRENIDDDNKPKNCGIRINNQNGNNNNPKDGEAKLGEFPWTVTILKLRDNRVECGGSLITPSIVLTAAHCVHGKPQQSLNIRAGDSNSSKTKKLEFRKIKQIIIHEKFNERFLMNDIALILLKKPFEISAFINTICLPPSDIVFETTQCISCGYGKVVLKANSYSKKLKLIDNLTIVQTNECQEAIFENTQMPKAFNLHSSFICAISEENKDLCKGDGGSALICPTKDNPDQYYQAGIVSWGIDCGIEKVPGMYAKVTEFYNWIEETVNQLGESDNSYLYKAELPGEQDQDNNNDDYNNENE